MIRLQEKTIQPERGLGCATARFIKSLRNRFGSGDFASAAQNALDGDSCDTGTPGGYRINMMLSQLESGECGTILKLTGNSQGRLRLLEMGMTPGTHVRILRRAAFGGPIDVLVRGYHLSLRCDEASLIWVGEDESLVPTSADA